MKKYKILKLTKKELRILETSIAQVIIDLKRNEDMYEDKIYIKNRIKELQNLLKYLTYVER